MPLSPSIALRPHDRVRITLLPESTGSFFNIHDRLGFYWEAGEMAGGGIGVQRSDTSTPPFAINVVVAGTATGDSEPQIAFDAIDRAHLVFTRHNGGDNVMRCVSDDDGATWSDPVLLFSGAKHPVARETDVGTVIYAAFIDGNVTAVEEIAPEVFSDPWTFLDSAGVPYVIDDAGFSIAQAMQASGRWLFVSVLGSLVQRAESADDCRTWFEMGSPFSGGGHAVVRETDIGTAISAARIGTNITADEEVGPENFSATWQFRDDTGSLLTFDDTGFSFTQAKEGAGRWVLVASVAGDKARFASADDCRTWTQIG